MFGIPLFIYLSSYQKTYLDYTTGRVRIDHIIFGSQWKSTFHDTWITPYASTEYTPDWHMIGYRNQKLGKTMINSMAGKLRYDMTSIEKGLFVLHADDSIRERVAQFVLNKINQPGDDGTVFVDATRACECFLDAIFRLDLQDDTISYEQVLLAIDQCSQAIEPSTISP
tara:strand:+ start:1248 stop:1754 length:507 start_codon:yes stop_codon:yes gene_type:complete